MSISRLMNLPPPSGFVAWFWFARPRFTSDEILSMSMRRCQNADGYGWRDSMTQHVVHGRANPIHACKLDAVFYCKSLEYELSSLDLFHDDMQAIQMLYCINISLHTIRHSTWKPTMSHQSNCVVTQPCCFLAKSSSGFGAI